MLVELWAPHPDGRTIRNYATVSNVRRFYGNSNIVAAFSLDIPRVGTFRECRLWQYDLGGFFVKGESLLTAGEERYRHFIEFLEPFATILSRAVRSELIGSLREHHGIVPIEDEHIELTDIEMEEELDSPCPSFERAVEIVPLRTRRFHGARLQFDVTIGCSIRLKGCRLFGEHGRSRVVMPTSEGLSSRPIILEAMLEREILRRAEAMGRPHPPVDGADVRASFG